MYLILNYVMVGIGSCFMGWIVGIINVSAYYRQKDNNSIEDDIDDKLIDV